MVVVDHYKVLGIDHKASLDQIKKAYHSLAKKFHPDKNKNAGAEDKFKSISTSYAVLCDADKRRVFDMQRDADIESTRMKRSQPRKSESETSTQSDSSSTGWERFKTHESESWRSSYPSANQFFNTKNNSHKSKPKKREGAKTNRRHSDFSYTTDSDRPTWDTGTNTDEDFFDNIDTIFDEFFKCQFRGLGRTSKTFRFMFGSMMGDEGENDDDDDDDEGNGMTTEWFTIGENGKTSNASNDRQSSLNDIWDWSKPMFDKSRKPNFHSPRYDGSSRIQLPCVYCGRSMDPASLNSHQEVCGRFHSTGSSSRNAQTSPKKEFDEPQAQRTTDGPRGRRASMRQSSNVDDPYILRGQSYKMTP